MTIVVDDQTMAEVREAHQAVLSAEERFESRRGKGASRSALVEARARERSVLRGFGFATYGDFVLAERDEIDLREQRDGQG